MSERRAAARGLRPRTSMAEEASTSLSVRQPAPPRDRARDDAQPKRPPPRRAGRRHELRRGRRARRQQIRWLRDTFDHHRRAGRAQHAGRHGRLRGDPRPRSRRDHRARHPRGRARRTPRSSPAYLGEETDDEASGAAAEEPASNDIASDAAAARRPPRRAPLLVVDDLAVGYGGIKALKGVSLEVRARRDRRDDRRQRRRQDDHAEDHRPPPPDRRRPHPLRRQVDLACRLDGGARRGRHLARPEGRAIFSNLSVRENLELGAWCHQHGPTMARDRRRRGEALPPASASACTSTAARSPAASSRCSRSAAP